MASERNALGRWIDERGISYAEAADTISALTGKRINANSVKLWTGRPTVPKAWAAALELDLTAPAARPAEEWAGTPPPSAASSEGFEPPADPGGPRIPMQGSPPPAGGGAGEYGIVRERIAQAYAAMGAGASMISHNEGYARVADSYKDDLAKAWVSAAKESKNVAKIVEFMQSGGAVGELVVSHFILVLGWVYVSGRAPGLHSIYGRFEPYHRAAAVARVVEESDEALDGRAASPVGDAAGFARV